ncbi:hypothetical protein [Streptomyces sp. B3I8]|jgi:hypothetical protein|uniref:hypothetical protein n=1 Tax=Streptomyces sp. B3I8 TaxID=3042303 RepID=UPI002784F55B|nr:hypothetical protein [Streptomyces sp. B3I8]MDQ0785376.1 hypothetical protein [Streptomyces sp. B3I8]
MGYGFPTAKFFRIINRQTGVCLSAASGGTTYVDASHMAGGGSYSHTNDQHLAVGPVKNTRGEVWFFDDRERRSFDEAWCLVNANRDIRSAYTLHAGPRNESTITYGPDDLGLIGWGQKGQTQWEAGDGRIWPAPRSDKFVTVLWDGHKHRVGLADRAGENQFWTFQTVELPGEAVPTERLGIYDQGPPGRDPLKWRTRM